MGHTYTALHYHLVFSTKERLQLIRPEFKNSLFAYIAKTINTEFGHARKINGVGDHIHVCADLKQKFALSNIVRALKANSTNWVNKNFQFGLKFGWQEGYGAFTVSKSSITNVVQYIGTQEEHHSKML